MDFFLEATETFKVPIFQKIVKGLLYKCQILSSSFFPSYKALPHSLWEVSVHTCLEEYLFRKTPAKQVRWNSLLANEAHSQNTITL